MAANRFTLPHKIRKRNNRINFISKLFKELKKSLDKLLIHLRNIFRDILCWFDLIWSDLISFHFIWFDLIWFDLLHVFMAYHIIIWLSLWEGNIFFVVCLWYILFGKKRFLGWCKKWELLFQSPEVQNSLRVSPHCTWGEENRKSNVKVSVGWGCCGELQHVTCIISLSTKFEY